MYCDFVLLAVRGTETYFQLSQHLLLDQSPYNGPTCLISCCTNTCLIGWCDWLVSLFSL